MRAVSLLGVSLALLALSSAPATPQVSEEWVARFDGGIVPETSGHDENATATCLDGDGNVCVTGRDYVNDPPVDWITVKYNPEGDELWVAPYAGPAGEGDTPHATAADAANCVYVTGNSDDGVSNNYLTIKYDTVGDEAWIVEYDGAGLDDVASAIAVDSLGCAYVTGRSGTATDGDDFVTIKYDPLGGEEWVARYVGPHGADRPHAIAIDDTGNVYVTGGSSAGVSSWMDFATVKYGPDGSEKWVATRPGTDEWDGGGWGIAVDDSGNVYVAGRGFDDGYPNDYDYVVIKYGPSGAERWVATYDGGSDLDDVLCGLAVDGSGNSYVAGRTAESPTDGAFATVKYDPTGNEEWVAVYGGPPGVSGLFDGARDVALDATGHVWVTGSSAGEGTGTDYAVVKYDTEGNEVWIARYDGPPSGSDDPVGIAPDGLGGAFVAGSSRGSMSETDIATVRYDSTGAELWVAREALGPPYAPQGEDIARAIAVDVDGSVYVTGESYWPDEWHNCVTVKYDPSGSEEWVHSYNSNNDGDDRGVAATTDGAGYVYVAGTGSRSSDDRDFLTIKLTAAGGVEWIRTRNGPGGWRDYAEALAVDGSGGVCVVGRTYSSGGGDDMMIVKYAADGTEEWIQIWDEHPDIDAAARAVVIDDSGNVYVTGRSGSTQDDRDILTIKYAPDGTLLWFDRQTGVGGGSDIALDGSGGVYVAGSSQGVGTYADYAVIRYNALGDTLWRRTYEGPLGWDDRARAIAVDGMGNVLVTGESRDDGPFYYGYATLKYLPDGTLDWIARYDGPYGDSYATDIEVDPLGNAYVTGRSVGPTDADDFLTIMYGPDGSEKWLARYDHGGAEADQACGLALDERANVYVTGYSWDVFYGADYATVKYANETVTGVSSPAPGDETPGALALGVPRPNPVAHTAELWYTVPGAGAAVRLTIHDLSGRVVTTVREGPTAPGRHVATWDCTDGQGRGVAAGVYFVRLASRGEVRVRKVVVLR